MYFFPQRKIQYPEIRCILKLWWKRRRRGWINMFTSASLCRVIREAEGASVEEGPEPGRAVPPTWSFTTLGNGEHPSSPEQFEKHFLIFQLMRNAYVLSLGFKIRFKSKQKTASLDCTPILDLPPHLRGPHAQLVHVSQAVAGSVLHTRCVICPRHAPLPRS